MAKIKWIRKKEGSRPGSVLFEGDDFFYTIWSTDDKEKGDTVEYKITKEGEYNSKPQKTVEFIENIPIRDTNDPPGHYPSQLPLVATPAINLRLEAMKMAVQLVISAKIEPVAHEDITAMCRPIAEDLLMWIEGSVLNGYTPNEKTEKGPF